MDLYFSRGSGITAGVPRQRPRTEQDPRDTRIEEQEREIARLREELTRVEGDRDHLEARPGSAGSAAVNTSSSNSTRRGGQDSGRPRPSPRTGPKVAAGDPAGAAGAHYGRQACQPASGAG